MNIKLILAAIIFFPIQLTAEIIVNGKLINTNCYYEKNQNQSLLIITDKCENNISDQVLISQKHKKYKHQKYEICMQLKNNFNYIELNSMRSKFHDKFADFCREHYTVKIRE